MTRLENWFITRDERLSGNVYSYPNDRHWDGKEVLTSQIVNLDNDMKTAITKSGTIYHLGTPTSDYVEYLLATNMPSGKILKARLNNNN